jgi:putative thioredoxin
MNSNIIDLTLENFQQVMMEDSQSKLILVQFFAQQSEACQQLTPILTGIASEYGEQLILARVDVEQQQEIVGQFGVQGLPTLILVKEGRPLDGVAGPQTDAQVRELLEKHLPKPEELLLAQAQELVQANDYQQAYSIAKQAYELAPELGAAKLLMADCFIENGQVTQAKTLLETITLVDQDTYYQSIVGKVELAEQAAESPEIKALEAELAQQPDNLELKVKLAIQLHQANKTEDALALLLAVLKQDLNFGDAKKVTLDMINALPDGEPLKSQYRRKIYSLLY